MTRRIAIVGCRKPVGGEFAKMRTAPLHEAWAKYKAIEADMRRFLVGICGSRMFRSFDPFLIVSGGASGIDAEAAAIARTHGVEVVEHLPDYATHGSKAPLVRNARIVADCDELQAWPAPWSRGTWHAVKLARAAGKPVTVHEVKA